MPFSTFNMYYHLKYTFSLYKKLTWDIIKANVCCVLHLFSSFLLLAALNGKRRCLKHLTWSHVSHLMNKIQTFPFLQAFFSSLPANGETVTLFLHSFVSTASLSAVRSCRDTAFHLEAPAFDRCRLCWLEQRERSDDLKRGSAELRGDSQFITTKGFCRRTTETIWLLV